MSATDHLNVEPIDSGGCGHNFYQVTLEAEEDPTERVLALRCADCGYTRPVPEAAEMEFYGMGSCSLCECNFAVYAPRAEDVVLAARSLCPKCAASRRPA